ncbi:ubiquitin-like small modifier protein SAMP2 [Halobaculum sp. EA56]|uniref:ubiquitin-like small modifier protein SAMP2 n=1 Tax=Halobaculum sp. EA56 TaxID=3421648 RepID=UPI003EBD0BD5
MDVTAEVVGEGTETLSLADDATYADVCRATGYSPHEVTVLVDGTPVPEDAPCEAAEVTVLRLIKGG